MEGRGFESQFGADSGVARRDYTKNYVYGERNYVYGEEYAMDENSSLAAAVRDSSAHQDSSLSSVYRESALASAHRESYRNRLSSNSETPLQKTYTSNGSSSFRSSNESKQGFWSALARKAKSALLEEGSPAESPELEVRNRSHLQQARANILASMPERRRQSDAPALQKGIEAITSSLTYIGGALEEGLTIVENKASDIISDTKRSIRKKSDAGPERKDSDILSGTRRSMKKKADVGEAANPHKDNVPGESKDSDILSGIRRPMRKRADCVEAANLQWQNKKAPAVEANHETQLKASRDVAMAMAAKVKVLLRELKTLKADLAFAKERCAQLEEENKVLRESLEKGDRPDEDDLIRLQLETLLAEKSRLAQENANYARENRFLREIVEYHRLTMQDVVCLDENIEEVTEIGLDPNTETQIEMISLEKSISSVSC